MSSLSLVTGAGGFIGHHLVRYLKAQGRNVRAVDVRAPEFEASPADEFETLDLRAVEGCANAVRGVDEVFHLAADMGGIGYISSNHASIASNNTLIDTHMLQQAAASGVKRFFYASSACIYPMYRQTEADVSPLREDDAYPADPEEGYGWEKLYGEKLCEYYDRDGHLATRVARFHNVYGPLGTYEGGREKAPAAVCRKVAQAADGDDVEVWGDGKQTRSFMYIDDCVEGIDRIMRSDSAEPLNLGRDELVTIDELIDVVARIAGKTLQKRYDLTRPQGVRGRNSDNDRLRQLLQWEPQVPLEQGLSSTYGWIVEEIERSRQSTIASA